VAAGRVPWTVYLLRCGDGTLTPESPTICRSASNRIAAARRSAYTRARRPVVLAYQEVASAVAAR